MNKRYCLLSIVLLLLCISIPAECQLPSVRLKDLSGKNIDTSTLSNGGKPFIISFFAVWCKPCQRELKAISEYYADWQAETGVKVFAVSIDDAQNTARVKPLVDSYGWEFDVLLDPNGDFKQALGVNAIPATFICDGNSKIISTRTGYTEGSEIHLIEDVRKWIKNNSK
jgi:peroxiredoxin